MQKRVCGSILALVLAAGNPPVGQSQSVTATILGSVTDSSGALVPEATVTVTEVQTGIVRRSQTNTEGLYIFPYLPPGQYTVEVERAGFKRFMRQGVQLSVAQTLRVDAQLQPGQITEVIDVVATAPLLQTDRADINRTVNSRQVRELPVANRSFQALVGLLPGVTPPVASFTVLEDPQGTHFYQANGQGNSANNVQVDGLDNNNPTLGLTIYIPPAESVEEVNISTSNYNAEFGRAGGAVMNVVTRGGTNELKGSLFAFNRIDDLRARNFFNFVPQPKPSLVRNQFGGTLGGPVVRNRVFFFGGYQGTIERRGVTNFTTLPTAEMRAGDFSGIPQAVIYDPLTGNPNGTGRTPFTGNRIPANRFHPVPQRILRELIPTNQPGLVNNVVGNVPFRYDGSSYDGRSDHVINDRNTVFVKYNYSPYQVTQRSLLERKIGDGVASRVRTHTAIINYTRQWSPTLLMEARGGYNRYFTDVNGDGIDDPIGPSLGIANPNPDPISTRGMPRFNVAGMPGIGTPVFYPLVNADNLFNAVNTWTKFAGRHSLKWGADLRRIRADRFQPQGLNFGPRGRFDYNPGTTALPGAPLGPFGTLSNAFAAFLIGAPDATYRTYQTVTPTNRVTQAFFFVHDTFQVTSRLTLDLGLRYEAHTTVKPRYAGGASNYDPTTNSLLVAGVGEVDMATRVGFDGNNWAPRFGFALRPAEKTVIRGGYGISYYTGRFGFTGGTLSTQFPVIYNVQEGVTGDFRIDGTQDSLPPVPLMPIPSSGIIAPAPNQGFFTIPQNNPIPFVHTYNFTVQRELGWNTALDVAYVGSLGRRLPYQRNLNFALPGTGAAGLIFNRIFGRTAEIQQRANGVNNNYNSLQANLQRRFAGGLSFGAAYTWSRTLGVGDDQASFIINADIRRNYGPTGFDRTHMFVFNHIWELPVGRGKRWLNAGPAAYLLGGWQMAGIFRAVSGSPFSIVADAGPCNCPGNGNFADVLGPTRRLGGVGPGQLFFDTSAFAAPSPGRFGNAGRNIVRGPRLVNYDFSLFKLFPVGEKGRLELRAEAYNLTNTPQFANPVNNVNAGNFGQILGTILGRGERELQLAARFVF